MNCVCGCGARIERGQIDTNLLAGAVAIELAAWARARALSPSVASGEVEGLIASGAPRYQGLLVAIHTCREPEGGEVEAIREWLDESRALRLRLHRELPVPKRKIKLSDAEQAQIDRRHPERSFSGEPAGAAPAEDPLLEALLVVALEDVRAGRPEEAKQALRRFLSDGS